MTALTLRLRETPLVSVDVSVLSPPRLAGLTRAKIEALELALGNRSVRVGELFEVRGDDWDNVVIEKATERLTHLGAGMQSGTLMVNGENVEGWMSAMTMQYSADKPDVYDKVKVGDQITAKVYDGDFATLHDVQVVK
jgi:formylmethanofuran dehydrogenase subunit C